MLLRFLRYLYGVFLLLWMRIFGDWESAMCNIRRVVYYFFMAYYMICIVLREQNEHINVKQTYPYYMFCQYNKSSGLIKSFNMLLILKGINR